MRPAVVFGILVASLLWPASALAAVKQTLLQAPDVFSPQLEIFSEVPFTLQQADGTFLLSVSPGATHLKHILDEAALQFDQLAITLASDQPLELTVLPNLETAKYTYEFQREIAARPSPTTVNFSLRHQLFAPGNQMGIALTAREPAQIRLLEISLLEQSFWQNLFQPVRDYFQVAPYSGFTVNVFPTPRVFGRSAFVYFLPLLLLLVLLLVFARKYRRAAVAGLLVLWLVTDLRMSYEFARYQLRDYETWIKPPVWEKRLRTYDDFYVFADWLKENLPPGQAAVNFYYLANEHYPRLLQYYLYPVRVIPQGTDSNTYVVFHESGVKQELLLEEGAVVAEYDEDSFIFVKSDGDNF